MENDEFDVRKVGHIKSKGLVLILPQNRHATPYRYYGSPAKLAQNRKWKPRS
jgi:hypothetical protein